MSTIETAMHPKAAKELRDDPGRYVIEDGQAPWDTEEGLWLCPGCGDPAESHGRNHEERCPCGTLLAPAPVVCAKVAALVEENPGRYEWRGHAYWDLEIGAWLCPTCGCGTSRGRLLKDGGRACPHCVTVLDSASVPGSLV